jgi:hypothetical protein
MKHNWVKKAGLIYLAIMIGLAFTSSLAAASGNRLEPAAVTAESVIDFEGLAAGTIVSSLSSGNGISGATVSGEIQVFGFNPRLKASPNAAMIFDAACPPEGTPEACTGHDSDLFKPELGNVLIISKDLDSDDPNDADYRQTYLEFDYSGWGPGKVTVESIDVLDIEDFQSTRGTAIQLYSGGAGGTLLATVPIPHTGNNGLVTVPVGVSGVDFMRVVLNGSGAIDNLNIDPEFVEILYMSDTGVLHDGFSTLYRVEIDEAAGKANMIPLPSGTVNYDHVDTLSSTPDGTRLYFVDDGGQPPATAQATLAYYDVASATVTGIGVVMQGGVKVTRIDQAAFSPAGTLYITSSKTDKLYTLDLATAAATDLGAVVNQASGAIVDISGADIAFTSDGALYIWINTERAGAPRGLYSIALPPAAGVVNATFIGLASDEHPFWGLAVRANGNGDLVGTGSTEEEGDELHVINKEDGSNVIPPLTLYLDGEPFDATAGDMSIGPFTP